MKTLKTIFKLGILKSLFWSLMVAFIAYVIGMTAIDFIPKTKADNRDTILEQLNTAYDQSRQAEIDSLRTYQSNVTARCYVERSTASYKLSKGYEPERTKELEEKAEMQCGAF